MALVRAGQFAVIAFVDTAAQRVENQAAQLATIPRALLIPAGIGFAVSNAFAEELLYRGVIREGLRGMVSPVVEVLITSTLFGIAHLTGFPSGVVGIAMVFVWGVSLGIIRNRTRGMAGPILVHIAADLTIFAILATR